MAAAVAAELRVALHLLWWRFWNHIVMTLGSLCDLIHDDGMADERTNADVLRTNEKPSLPSASVAPLLVIHPGERHCTCQPLQSSHLLSCLTCLVLISDAGHAWPVVLEDAQ